MKSSNAGHEWLLLVGIVVACIVLAVGINAQQQAEITSVAAVPARFQPVGPTEKTAIYTTTVMRDTKPGSGNTCFLLLQPTGLGGGPAMLQLPAVACN